MALFEQRELSDFVQYVVPVSQAEIAERVVDGWLKGATGLTEWPDPLPAQLFSWALELGALAVDNPTGLATRAAGDESDTYLITRRAEILAEVRAWAAGLPGSATTVARPRGSFPPPQAWPNPAGVGWPFPSSGR